MRETPRQRGAQARWAGLTEDERREATAPGRAAAIETRYPLRELIRRLAVQPDSPVPARWMADEIEQADSRILSVEDLARIDAYVGDGRDLHELLPAVLPLRRSRWYETRVVAQHGTPMLMGYLAVATSDGIEIGFAAATEEPSRVIGPMGPVFVTAAEMQRPASMNDEAWREIRSAAGIVIRALLLRM